MIIIINIMIINIAQCRLPLGYRHAVYEVLLHCSQQAASTQSGRMHSQLQRVHSRRSRHRLCMSRGARALVGLAELTGVSLRSNAFALVRPSARQLGRGRDRRGWCCCYSRLPWFRCLRSGATRSARSEVNLPTNRIFQRDARCRWLQWRKVQVHWCNAAMPRHRAMRRAHAHGTTGRRRDRPKSENAWFEPMRVLYARHHPLTQGLAGLGIEATGGGHAHA